MLVMEAGRNLWASALVGCRQKLREFAVSGDVKVTMATMDGATLVMSVAELLPGAFTAGHMEKE